MTAELDAAVAQQNLELGRENLARVNALAAADSASEADVSRIEATVAASDLLVAQSRNLAALQRERLAIAMHDSGPRSYQIGDDFKAAAAAPEAYDIPRLVRLAREPPRAQGTRMQTRAYQSRRVVARSRVPRFRARLVANPNSRYSRGRRSRDLGTWRPDNVSAKRNRTGLSRAAAVSAQAEASVRSGAHLAHIHAEVAEAVLASEMPSCQRATSRRLVAA